MEENKMVEEPEEVERFPELTEKQREFLNNFLIMGFSKKLWEIPNSLEFVEGRTDEMSFGMFNILRTAELNMVLSTSKEVIEQYNHPRDMFKSLFMIISLPHS